MTSPFADLPIALTRPLFPINRHTAQHAVDRAFDNPNILQEEARILRETNPQLHDFLLRLAVPFESGSNRFLYGSHMAHHVIRTHCMPRTHGAALVIPPITDNTAAFLHTRFASVTAATAQPGGAHEAIAALRTITGGYMNFEPTAYIWIQHQWQGVENTYLGAASLTAVLRIDHLERTANPSA